MAEIPAAFDRRCIPAGRYALRCFLSLSLALLAGACGGDAPVPEIPETPETPETPEIPERPFATPTGPHAIGMTEHRWTDASRAEPFTKDPEDVRSVAVRIRYPAGESGAADTLTFPEPTGDLLADALGSWDYLDRDHFPEWVADAFFVLDQLETLNGAGRFEGRLDLDRIGMYGWSFCGATSIEMSVIDDRVKAAIDHDGQLFGSAPSAGTSMPFMLMHSGETPEVPPDDDPEVAAANARALEQLMAEVDSTSAAMMTASAGDWYDVTIAGTSHGNFSDLVIFIPAFSPGIDPARGHEIINALTVAFFDRYLKGAEAPLLDDPGAVFPEVDAERRVRQ